MWAHYADDCRGFCVRYDISDLGINNLNLNDDSLMVAVKLYPVINAGLFPVYYRSRRAILSYLESNDFYKKQIALMKACLVKATSWSKEQEYRIIVDKNESMLVNDKMYFPFVDKVFFGSRMDEEFKISFASVCNKQKIHWTELKPYFYSYKFEESRELMKIVIKRERFSC